MTRHDTPTDAADPLETARLTAAHRAHGDGFAAPALAVDGHLLVTPTTYPVRTPKFRARDYGGALTGGLDAAIADLDAAALGPGGVGAARSAPRRQRDRADDDTHLVPAEARRESLRAALALLTDETAAHAVVTATGLDLEPWTRGGIRAPGTRRPSDPPVKPVIALSTAGERVVAPSRRGRPRELPTKWPPTAALEWWEHTVKPAVEQLPGLETTTGDDPMHARTWVRFTDAYAEQVCRGVVEAAAHDDALARALSRDTASAEATLFDDADGDPENDPAESEV